MYSGFLQEMPPTFVALPENPVVIPHTSETHRTFGQETLIQLRDPALN
mgnify:CR=1 FL=1